MSEYEPHDWINCIDAFVVPDGDWLPCPNCGLKPKVWLFDNGRSTACGCWNDTYRHFSIHAESINSAYSRTKKTEEHSPEDLMNNWNHWCKTGEVLFEHAGKRNDGRW